MHFEGGGTYELSHFPFTVSDEAVDASHVLEVIQGKFQHIGSPRYLSPGLHFSLICVNWKRQRQGKERSTCRVASPGWTWGYLCAPALLPHSGAVLLDSSGTAVPVRQIKHVTTCSLIFCQWIIHVIEFPWRSNMDEMCGRKNVLCSHTVLWVLFFVSKYLGCFTGCCSRLRNSMSCSLPFSIIVSLQVSRYTVVAIVMWCTYASLDALKRSPQPVLSQIL